MTRLRGSQRGDRLGTAVPAMDGSKLPANPFAPSPEALFRFHVVSQVVAGVRAGRPQAVVVKEVASRAHLSWDGNFRLRKASARSVYRWLAAFSAGGISSLEPAARAHTLSSAVLPEKFIDFLRSEKSTDDEATIPELIRRAAQLGIIASEDDIDRTTVWRAAQRMQLPCARRSNKREADIRRFAYPHRMMMVLCDGKQFRAGPTRTRRLVLFFIDDASRYTPLAVVGPSESTELFLRGLYELIRRVGFMDILFLDGGPGFISADTAAVCVRLGVLLIHGTPEYPEGHGKIERFHQTAWQDILRALTAVGVGDDFASLELRLNHYLSTQYNQRPHEALEHGQLTPAARWAKDTRELRFPADDAELRERFVITESRDVSSDNVVRVGGLHYEVPRGHRGTSIQIFRQTLDQTVSIIHDGKRTRLHAVDLEGNATSRRARPQSPPQKEESAPPRTAAQIAFDRDFGPVVAPDGGYVPPTKIKE